MRNSDEPLRNLGLGLIVGVLVMGLFLGIALLIHLRPGFYGFGSQTIP